MPAWASGSVNEGAASPPSPASPEASPPPPTGGSSHALRRLSSAGYLSEEGRATPSPPPELADDGWARYFLLHFAPNLICAVFYLAWTQAVLFGPALCLSAWLWCVGKLVSIPLSLTKWLLTALTTPASERARRKRTVLISGGSTVQAIHLARNFHSAGARVVAFEVAGHFGLARFSTAVDKFYTVPDPRGDRADRYVAAVKRIVEEERASFYVPVSAAHAAYYDALVKPHAELMGCQCFCPGLKEVCVLDDVAEVLRRCAAEGMATPRHYPVASVDEVLALYEAGALAVGRHVMVAAGPAGCRERTRVPLPRRARDFRPRHPVGRQRPWVVVRDYPGDHFVTCTAVKESRVVANVTCRVDPVFGGITPVDHAEIELWIKRFVGKLSFLRPLAGHLSFRFVVSSASGSIVPLGCRVGVSLSYVCHTGVHPRLIWKPCRHFDPRSSGPPVSDAGRYWMHQAVMDTLRRPGLPSLRRLAATVLGKQEALFAYWDPLPYFAYYHVQLPLTNLMRFLRGHSTIAHGGHGFRTVTPR